jgi:hypothetical protein
VHNIIYAGYEYALEFDLAPHRDFEITKHFLLPDDEVPIIEIAVGDEHGNPVFIPYKNAPYLDIVKKLEKNPGKGNYTFMLMPDEYFGDDDMFEKFEDENEDEESKKAKRMYAEMNEEIDATTHDMDSKETLTFYKFIVTSFKTKNDGEQDDNLSASEQEDIQLKTVTEMATLLVSKFNDKFYDEKPITISDLMLH